MATIKDVAAKAGVSVGTVSNVINGKTNNPQLIHKVEAAIKTLGFHPSVKARSLKMAQSYLIGIIVSNLEDRNIQYMLSAVEKKLSSSGYNAIIKTTGNNKVLEKKQVEYFLQLGVDGIIVNTSVYYKSWYSRAGENKIPTVFMGRPVHLENQMLAVQVDYTAAMGKCFDWIAGKRKKNVAIILEAGALSEDFLRVQAKEQGIELHILKVSDGSRENGFRGAYQLMTGNLDIEVIIAGSEHLAQGIRKALGCICPVKEVDIVCMKPANWMEDDEVYEAVIEISPYEIGGIAADFMMEAIGRPKGMETKMKIVEAALKKKQRPVLSKAGNRNTKDKSEEHILRVAMLDAPITTAVQKICSEFEDRYGVWIELIKLKYHELWKLASSPQKLEELEIDVIMYDIVWKSELIKAGSLDKITFLLEEMPEYFRGLIDDSLEKYGMHSHELYGIPFMPGTQLLFYQKDLFEDSMQNIQYQRRYGVPLKIPETWSEFNQIAEFFTRDINPNSLVKYGTAMTNAGNMYSSVEFLDRLWAYHTDIILEHKVHFHGPLIRIALEEYRKSYRYAKQDMLVEGWEEVAATFKSGEAAMVVLYDSYASGINDAIESKVAGNVGCALVPGQKSVLGGWSLGRAAAGQKKELAEKFMLWACSEEVSNPLSILSGTSNRKGYYQDKESYSVYPWKDVVLKGYRQSGMRGVAESEKSRDYNFRFYDEILGKELGVMLRNNDSVDEVMERVQKEAEKF